MLTLANPRRVFHGRIGTRRGLSRGNSNEAVYVQDSCDSLLDHHIAGTSTSILLHQADEDGYTAGFVNRYSRRTICGADCSVIGEPMFEDRRHNIKC